METPSLLAWLRVFLAKMSGDIKDVRSRKRFVIMGIGFLGAGNPKTITSAINFLGQTQQWSAPYKLFSRSKWEPESPFKAVIEKAVSLYPVHEPVISAIDDTLVPKTGKKIPGTAYARDPLSPPFQVNLIMGQRYLETVILCHGSDPDSNRGVPVAYRHAPPVKARKTTSPAEEQILKEEKKKHNLSVLARQELFSLREAIDATPDGCNRVLIQSADGSFANKCFLKDPPHDTVVVARVRKDTAFVESLPAEQRKGNRKYGPRLPPLKNILTDDNVETLIIEIDKRGRKLVVRYKCIKNVRWPGVTGDQPCHLIVLKPIPYRLTKAGRVFYRQPAYLVVTGALEKVTIEQAIRAYLFRWEIEVSFRDQKTILGLGKAQVWNKDSVAKVPAFMSACYAALLLASIELYDDKRGEAFPPREGWRNDPVTRPSLRDLLNVMRRELADEKNQPRTLRRRPRQVVQSPGCGLQARSTAGRQAMWGVRLAGSCHAAGCKPATRLGDRRAWFPGMDRVDKGDKVDG